MRTVGAVVIAAVAVAGVSGCGSKPKSSASSGGTFKACMVTDTGGIDDKSFNASSWAGLQAAQAGGKIKASYLSSSSENDYVPNINSLVSEKCDLIVTVGGLMAQATDAAAKANPSLKFAIVDAPSQPPNLHGMQIDSAQGAFLAGYLAAGMTKTGKVATFGGLPIQPVTVYMDGFWEGVQYYNTQKGKNVQVLGWNEHSPNGGSMAQSFSDQTIGKNIATNFINAGADIIFPVAGQTGLGAAAAAQQSGGKVNVIWVDSDGCDTAPQYCSVFLTSVIKDVKDAVQKIAEQTQAGQFDASSSIGTLSNGASGLAPFHDFASQVPQSLQTELTQVKSDIESGKITITSPNQPK